MKKVWAWPLPGGAISNWSFRLESTRLFYYFSLEIKLTGELGERATPDPAYRHLGVTGNCKMHGPELQNIFEGRQTENELKEMMEIQKDECSILPRVYYWAMFQLWQGIVDCLNVKNK